MIIEIESHSRVLAFGFLRFLFDTQGLPGSIELHNTVTLWITHTIGEHLGALCQTGGLLQTGCQSVTIKNIVPEDQAGRLAIQEAAPDQEGFSQPAGGWLLRILNIQPQLTAVTQQLPEIRQVLRR